MDEWWILVAALMSGAVLGSFLCLVIERFPVNADGRAWLARICRPASACNLCGGKLTSRDLVPLLSWLALRGHCRHCGGEISGYSFYIELITALMLTVLAMTIHQPALLAWLTLFSGCALILSEVDRRHLLLPDALTLPLLWCGLIFNMQLSPQHLQQSVAGALAGYLSLWLLSWGYRQIRKQEGIGLGDAKYLAAIGAWAGVFALPVIAMLAAGAGIISWLTDRLRGGKAIQQPFGPSLTIAGWSVLIAQHSDNDWFNFLL